jgi:hypothetical protein
MTALRVHQLDQRHPTNEVNPTHTIQHKSRAGHFIDHQHPTVTKIFHVPPQWNGLQQATSNYLSSLWNSESNTKATDIDCRTKAPAKIEEMRSFWNAAMPDVICKSQHIEF